jgi:hypothetical protein
VALDLAARRLGDRPHADEDDLLDLGLVLAGHRRPHRSRDLLRIAGPPLDLLDDDQALLAPGLHRERGAAAGAQVRVRPLGRQLEVLGIEVAAAQDDQVLEPARHVELAVEEEAEVARAQERPRLGVAGQPGLEVSLGGRGVAPVALRHARPGDPDLAHPSRRAGERGLGIDHLQPLLHPGPAAGHERPAGLPRGRLLRPPFLQVCRAHLADARRLAMLPAADEQRGLGQAVARVEGLAAEPAGGERRGEALHRLRAHRLRAVERQSPARQVEPRLLLRRDLSRAQLVGEARAAARRAAVAADRGQPA